MIYYNPIKQYLKNIINFLLSLFTKRFLLMIIIILIILLLHLNVNAESINEPNYVYRSAITSSLDEENNFYKLSGVFYSQNGRHDVDIDLPAQMYQGSFFIVYYYTTNQYMLIRMHDQRTFDNFYLSYIYDGGFKLFLSLSRNSNSINNLDVLWYNTETRSWEYNLNNQSGNIYFNRIIPCNIIYKKSCNVHYCYTSKYIYNSDNIINYQLFQTPNLTYITNAFKLDLNGFSFYGQQYNANTNTADYIHKYQLQNLYISLYNMNTKETVIDNSDILSRITVTTEGTDETTGYPIQSTILDFDTFFSALKDTSQNSDYLIFISPVLKDNYYFNNITLDRDIYYENFVDVSYWRYQYKTSTGVGSLVPSDSEGNPLNPEEGGEGGENDNNNEINNNLNNINNSIENINDNLFSTDADDITMDDFGVTSPVIEGSPDLTNIFDLVYDSFMSVYEDNIYRIQFQLPNGSTIYNYDIPADALSSKIPNELLTLISVFWWVVLGGAVIRFIVNIIHQVVTYSNGSAEGSGGSGGFLSELTMTPTEFVLFNILH